MQAPLLSALFAVLCPRPPAGQVRALCGGSDQLAHAQRWGRDSGTHLHVLARSRLRALRLPLPPRRMAPKRTRSGAKVNGKEEAPVGPRKYTREDLRSLIYHPVRPLDVISEEIGIKAEDIAKLDANENLHPVPAEMMKAVTDALQSLGSGCSAQIYPDPSQTNFRAAIAKLHGLTPDMVVAGSGSDDILDIIMRVIDADSCIICPPTFGMYKFLGTISRIRIIEVARKDNFHVDIPAVVKAIRANKCKLVMLPSPNNPTGTLLPNEDIKVLCAEDCIICVDEAYAVCVCAGAGACTCKCMDACECKTHAHTHLVHIPPPQHAGLCRMFRGRASQGTSEPNSVQDLFQVGGSGGPPRRCLNAKPETPNPKLGGPARPMRSCRPLFARGHCASGATGVCKRDTRACLACVACLAPHASRLLSCTRVCLFVLHLRLSCPPVFAFLFPLSPFSSHPS